MSFGKISHSDWPVRHVDVYMCNHVYPRAIPRLVLVCGTGRHPAEKAKTDVSGQLQPVTQDSRESSWHLFASPLLL